MSREKPDKSGAEQYLALLEVSESIALHRDVATLFHDLAQRLHRLVGFDYLNLILYDPERNVMRLHILETSEPTRVSPGLETTLDEGPSGWVWQNQQPWIVHDVDSETRYPRVTDMLREHRVKAACLLPLTTAHRRLGALGFGSRQKHAYAQADFGFLKQVAAQVAVAVDNVLHSESAQSYQRELARERDRLRMMLEVTNALVSNLERRELLAAIAATLRSVIPHDYTSLALYDHESGRLRLHALDFPRNSGLIQEEMEGPLEGSPAGEAILRRKPLLVDHLEADRFPSAAARNLVAEGLRSIVCVPLQARGRTLGSLNVASFRPAAFSGDDVNLLSQIGNEIAIALENALVYSQVEELKNRLAQEKLYLENEIRTAYDFEEIVGESAAIRRVLRDVETVAPTDSTVLIRGESGTGKELIARALHNLSARRERTFVKVSCAAIPTGLLESELFGHERGAFTGAITQKIGRFELAHQGTLFLDEIGDIPLELQPKLLRVLQEREFERLGGNRTLRVDVRVISATNQDLPHMVAERAFRSDLFYRLNVFPIVVPPLRERREDIPLLVRYFAQKYARRMDKHIETIRSEAMEALVNWNWPGNVRELENLIERAVILSRDAVLEVPTAELESTEGAAPGPVVTLKAAEREHIVRVLRECGWRVGGPKGAAARLGMKRTTLQSRMRKLGIARDGAH